MATEARGSRGSYGESSRKSCARREGEEPDAEGQQASAAIASLKSYKPFGMCRMICFYIFACRKYRFFEEIGKHSGIASRAFQRVFPPKINFDTAENELRKVWITDFADHMFRSHTERLVQGQPFLANPKTESKEIGLTRWLSG